MLRVAREAACGPISQARRLAKLADGLCSSALEMCGVQVWDRHVQLAAVAELVCRLPALQEGTFRVQWEGAVEMAGQAESDEVARARVQYGQLLERLRAMGLQAEAAEEPITPIQVFCATVSELRDYTKEDDNWCRTVHVAVRLGSTVLKLQLREQLPGIPGRPAWVVPEMGEMWELLP